MHGSHPNPQDSMTVRVGDDESGEERERRDRAAHRRWIAAATVIGLVSVALLVLNLPSTDEPSTNAMEASPLSG